MTGEIALRPFRYAFAAPCDENVLGQPRVRVRHLHVGKLHPTFGEFLNEIFQFTICRLSVSAQIQFPLRLGGKEEPTSRALDLQNTLLVTRILLKGINERG